MTTTNNTIHMDYQDAVEFPIYYDPDDREAELRAEGFTIEDVDAYRDYLDEERIAFYAFNDDLPF